MNKNSFEFKVFIFFCYLTLFLFVYLLFWQAHTVLLLAFAGILFAVFLNGISCQIRSWTSLKYQWALLIVILVLVSMVAIGLLFLGPRIIDQMKQMAGSVPQGLQALSQYLHSFEFGKRLMDLLASPKTMSQGIESLLGGFTNVFSNVLAIATGVVVIFVTGIFLAANPQSYKRQILQMLPPGRRARAEEILERLGNTLWFWLIARAALMTSNGILTAIGLFLLHIPLALTLGILAGTLNFIPNAGPILASLPAILIALAKSPADAIHVIILYIALQSLDGYVFTPLVEKQAVSLPAALILMNQILLSILLGFFGLLLATPLATTVAILVQALYIEESVPENTASPN